MISIMEKFKKTPAPKPTHAEVCEFAKVLAFDAGDSNRNCIRLITWRAGEALKMTGKTFGKYLPIAKR